MIKIYSTSWCPACVKAKKYLGLKGLAFSEINVADAHEDREEVFKVSGQRTVPVLDINGEIIVGFDKSLVLGYPFWVSIIMGTITGAAGGVIRDVFINEIPLIFRKEIYAMACVAGGIVYWLCLQVNLESYMSQIIGGATVFLVRILAVKYQITLPILKGENDEEANGKE